MSTIAREFTKEQLQQIIETDHVQCGEASALARIALASLEAEAVCVIDQSNLDYLKSGADADVWPASRKEMGDVLLYRTAPPAPANAEPVAWLWSHRKHPSEVSLVRPEDDERAEGAHWSGWSCQALYAAPPAPVSVPDEVCWEDVPEEITEDDMALASAWAHGFNQCRAAMLKHSEPFIVTSDHRMMEMPQVEAINAVTAMLQGVENAETPTTMQTAPALDSSPKIAELPSGNSPVIPDGWVLVPEEPTHEMLEAGDEQFGTYDVYRRMIAASPQQEVKS
ncbi:hypothetical protein VBI61_04315 [Enterobacter kobei]|uniref:hypothetical protein n=1 Tax=Enterobacter kobei TaxID=208224 RepID=UPI002B1E66F1|nr:hypothetical protein [Enterobacter kobei]MEA3824321.1 hypothetical protein [Enterobacter kobei]MEA4242638.1 hypothetical protein [Enterobacter kobei]